MNLLVPTMAFVTTFLLLPARGVGVRLTALHSPAAGAPRDRIALKRTLDGVHDRRVRADATRAALPGFVAALADELAAGAGQHRALAAAAAQAGPLAGDIARLCAQPQSAAGMIREIGELAGRPGAEGLRPVAACWQAAVEAGAAIGGVLDELADWLAGREADRDEARAELAGANASERILLLLPVGGVILSAFAGGGALTVLLGTSIGHLLVFCSLCLLGAGRLWARRILRAATGGAAPASGPSGAGRARLRRIAAALAAALTLAVLIGGSISLPVATAAGIGVWWFTGRLEPAERRRLAQQQAAALPLTLELLAACRRAGLPAATALAVTSTAVEGTLAEMLGQSSELLGLGASAQEAYQGWPESGECGAARRILIRCAESGAPAAPALSRIARRARQRNQAKRRGDIRRAGVAVLAPLACCYLPAFLLTGVVPLGISLFERLHRF